MGNSFFLIQWLHTQFVFVVGSMLKVVAFPDSGRGLRSQGLSGDSVIGDFNWNVKNGSCSEGGEQWKWEQDTIVQSKGIQDALRGKSLGEDDHISFFMIFLTLFQEDV